MLSCLLVSILQLVERESKLPIIPLMKKQKILMVSDIITVFSGGIEMYIFNATKELCDEWFEISTFGITWTKETIKKMRSYLLPFTGFNALSAVWLIWKCLRFGPDIIRFHSINRYHGRLPVLVSQFSQSQKLMMYHDLGYFHPFPHLVTEERQVLPWNFKNFLEMWRKAKKLKSWMAEWLMIILVTLKFCSIELLRLSLFSTIDKHLVPSEFMVKYLVQRGVDKQKIEVLPHFIVR